MPTETLIRNGQAAPDRLPEIAWPQRDDPLRVRAIERIHQVRRFKVHLFAFALGVPIMGIVWVLTEYFEEHTWPSRFASDPDVAGTWDPWFFWLAGIWAIILAVHAIRTYLGPLPGPIKHYVHRPVTDAEVEREIARLQSR
jgi:hypothetical protein